MGAAQAIALAVAAVFAWKTYEAAKEDREIARLEPVIRETQVLAAHLERIRSAGGTEREVTDLMGQQARLKVGLDLLPDPLPQTRLLARLKRDASYRRPVRSTPRGASSRTHCMRFRRRMGANWARRT